MKKQDNVLSHRHWRWFISHHVYKQVDLNNIFARGHSSLL